MACNRISLLSQLRGAVQRCYGVGGSVDDINGQRLTLVV